MRNWIKRTFRKAAWAPLTVFFFYAVAAKGFNAYIFHSWLDVPTHFAGGIAITYFFRVGIAHSEEILGRIPHQVQLILAIGLTAIVAIIWEFLEYISDVTLGTKMSLGLTDTLSDLFFGLLGGLVVVVIGALRNPAGVTNDA